MNLIRYNIDNIKKRGEKEHVNLYMIVGERSNR